MHSLSEEKKIQSEEKKIQSEKKESKILEKMQ